MAWEKAASLADLATKPALLKKSPKQVAVFKVDEQVFAIDNRCPHEGYPLTDGKVDQVNGDCLLTCNWHNWKFRLTDGQCILGGDNVRSYPVKIEDQDVWVDLADPPPEEIEAAVTDGLKTAFIERDFARICREITRLQFHGLDPMKAVQRAIEWSYQRFEFGTTHAYAAAADWIMLSQRFEDDWEKRLVCLAEPVDHMAFDALRHPEFEFADAGEPYSSEGLLEAIEAENQQRAESMIATALADGLRWSDLELTLATAALEHYNDFGHSLIYTYKMSQLIPSLQSDHEPLLIKAFVRHLCFTTREDTLPEFKYYGLSLKQLRNSEPTGGAADGDVQPDAEPSDPFPSGVQAVSKWVVDNYAQFAPLELYDRLLDTLARNTLHYDISYDSACDRPVNQNVGWLSLTHGMTFANAVRQFGSKYPELWPQGLLQMACFVGRNGRFVDLDADNSQWFVTEPQAFFESAYEMVLDHGQRDPIFSAHFLKTTVAVEEELSHASASCQRNLLAALNRFLHSPIKQKHTRRFARQAIELVGRDFN